MNKASKGLGEAFDTVSEIDTAVSEISDAMSGLTSKMSNLLQNKLGEFVNSGLTAAKDFIFNKFSFNLSLLSPLRSNPNSSAKVKRLL